MRKRDLTGQRFGKLIVVGEAAARVHGKVHWSCVCDCGVTKLIAGGSLRDGVSTSCGCSLVASNKLRTRHGMTDTPEHKVWRQMHTRCTNKRSTGFAHYGGRGITVCKEWGVFETFFADMGKRPSAKHSIERNNTNGNYNKTNCRWAISVDQNENTRRSRIWTVDGVSYPSSQKAAIAAGVDQATIVRWCNGYSQAGVKHAPKRGCSSTLKYKDAQ